jgi:prepilin-type N-terminal cleavage/methylation domain-containing protein
MDMNKKGFTLIELLIVVVIIGILAAIAIPRLGETRERAFVSAMQSDINQARQAMEMCYQDGAGTAIYTYEGCDTFVVGNFPADQNSYTAGVTMTITATTSAHYEIGTTHEGSTGDNAWSCSYNHAEGAMPGQTVCVQAGGGGEGGGEA